MYVKVKEKALADGEEKCYNYTEFGDIMTLRTFTDKNGNVWCWSETPEVIAALKKLTEFSGNYPGPLYAPHPHIKNKTKTDA